MKYLSASSRQQSVPATCLFEKPHRSNRFYAWQSHRFSRETCLPWLLYYRRTDKKTFAPLQHSSVLGEKVAAKIPILPDFTIKLTFCKSTDVASLATFTESKRILAFWAKNLELGLLPLDSAHVQPGKVAAAAVLAVARPA